MEISGQKFVELIAKSYSYVIDDCSEDKKAKRTKKCVKKEKLKSENYKNYLAVSKLDNKIRYLQRNKINIDNL